MGAECNDQSELSNVADIHSKEDITLQPVSVRIYPELAAPTAYPGWTDTTTGGLAIICPPPLTAGKIPPC